MPTSFRRQKRRSLRHGPTTSLPSNPASSYGCLSNPGLSDAKNTGTDSPADEWLAGHTQPEIVEKYWARAREQEAPLGAIAPSDSGDGDGDGDGVQGKIGPEKGLAAPSPPQRPSP